MYGLSLHVWLIAASVVAFLVLLGGCAHWASLAFGKDNAGKRSSLMPKWRRPSTLLIILAFIVFMSGGWLTHWSTRVSVMIVLGAFVLRHWENTEYADGDIDERDIENARDEVLAESNKPKDERSEDDDELG